MNTIARCEWVGSDPLSIAYHDREWGVPTYDDAKLFEFLVLEGAQAGLSWTTILHKRENYKKALDGFAVQKIARYDQKELDALLHNEGIIRNRLKIASLVDNAKAFLSVQKEYGDFHTYLWQFVKGKPIQNHFKKLSDIPSKTEISDAMSKDLRKRGFHFVGSSICYAFMQATGMVNDHITTCFRYKELQRD